MNIKKLAMKAAAAATPFLFALGAAGPALSAEAEFRLEERRIGENYYYCAEKVKGGQWTERFCVNSFHVSEERVKRNPEVLLFDVEDHIEDSIVSTESRVAEINGDYYLLTRGLHTVNPDEHGFYQRRIRQLQQLEDSEPERKFPLS